MARSGILEQYALRGKPDAKSGAFSGVARSPGDRLKHWAARVVRQWKKASRELAADNVHDLRTALRRCIAMEDAMARFDPDPRWGKMNRMARKLARSLSGWRDSDVLLDWLERLPIAKDKTGAALRQSIEAKRENLKRESSAGVQGFDPVKWKQWAAELARRADSIACGSLELQYVALEQWQKAYERHRFAMRSRSNTSYHKARVALKKLRYTAENFLPEIKEKWGDEPKQLQRLLGEVHDLDLLWSRFIALKHSASGEETKAWKSAIHRERNARLKEYALKTTGKKSLWHSWRRDLPDSGELEKAVLASLGAWARFRTPEFVRQQRVACLAAELYDSLAAAGLGAGLATERARSIVQAAALVEDAGRVYGEKGHHKESYRLIRKMPLPIGWRPADLQLTALAARYHRKALPQEKHREFSELAPALQRTTLFLAGILRLANALEQAPAAIRSITAEATTAGILVRAYGFDGEEPLLSRLATAKHLLEIACRRPIAVAPGTAGAPQRVIERKIAVSTDAA